MRPYDPPERDSGGPLDGLVLALTTFTVLPVRWLRPGARVDRGAARWAMAFAPVAGLFVGGAAVLVVLAGHVAGLGGLAIGVLAVATYALVTRGLHLDGLADLADGLGSHRPAEGALEIMKRSDIGPFGVVTLVFTLLVQVGAVAHAYGAGGVGRACAAVVVAAVTGRLAVMWACRRGVPSARPDGLGALVAGTVPRPWPPVSTVVPAGVAAALGIRYGLAVLVGVAVALAMERHAVRRLGGITGDVLGALLELAVTAALLVTTAVPQWTW